MPPTRKTEIGPLDGTPEKRMFWSIISDYDLITGISELIDNAIDIWMQCHSERGLTIDITLDDEQQFIAVVDNAGGVKREDLRLLISPGGSRNDRDSEVIGIFGVGGKRASIALGEHVEIRTRAAGSATYEVDITREWLEAEDWELPYYEIPDIEPGTTSVSISQVRRPFTDRDIAMVTAHISSRSVINPAVINA